MAKAHINIREEVAEIRKKTKSQSKKDIAEDKDQIATLLLAKKDRLDLKDLEKIIEEQSKELAMRSKTVDGLQRNFESLSEFCKSEKQRTQYLTMQVEELTKENERLSVKLKEQAGQKPGGPKPDDTDGAKSKGLKNDIDTLKEQNNSLHRAAQNHLAEIEKLEDNLRKLRIEKEKLNKELGVLKDKFAAKEKHNKELDQEISSLKSKIQQKEKALDESNNEKAFIKSKIDQLAQTLKTKESTIEGLHKRLSESDSLMAALREQLSGYESTKTSESQQITQYKIEQASLNRKIGELEKSLASITKELNESKHNSSLIMEQNKELLLKLKEYEDKDGSLKSRQQTMQKEYEEKEESWKSKLLNLENKLATEAQTYEKIIAGLREEVKAESLAKMQLMKEKAMLENKAQYIMDLQKKITALFASNDDYAKRCQEFSDSILMLKSSIIDNDTNMELSIAKMRESQNSLIVQLQSEKEQRAAYLKQLEGYRSKMEEQGVKIDELSKKISEGEKSLEEEREKSNALMRENSMLNDQIMNKSEQSSDTLANLRKSASEMQSVLDQKQKEIIMLKEKKKALETELAKLKELFEEKEKSLNASLTDSASLHAKAEKLKSEVRSHLNTIEEQKQMMERYKKDLMIIDLKDKEIKELTEKIKLYTDFEAKQKVIAMKESKINEAIKRVESVYESFECNLTCLVCGEISQKCTLCIPCGHCFCNKCIVKTKTCPNCSETVQAIYESKMLEEIACKFAYSKKMIDVFKDDNCWNYIK